MENVECKERDSRETYEERIHWLLQMVIIKYRVRKEKQAHEYKKTTEEQLTGWARRGRIEWLFLISHG
jgi:hypothetical protein